MTFEVNTVLDKNSRDFLSTLTSKVRAISLAQAGRTWPMILTRLRKLEQAGLVFSFVALVHPELPLCCPVMSWRTGDERPDFSKVSYQLLKRWSLPGVPTKCFIATRAAGRMFGGHGGRYPRESEETHDLHMAAVYLHFRSVAPDLAKSWVHEAQIKSERKQKRGKLPDAMIGKRVIEFGGAYKKQKLIGFHRYCEAKGFDYEVW